MKRDNQWRKRVAEKRLDLLASLGPKVSADGWSITWRADVFWHKCKQELRASKLPKADSFVGFS